MTLNLQYCEMNFNSVNVETKCVHKSFDKFFAFAINSFNNNLSSNCYVNNVVIEKNEKREKKKRKKKKFILWQYEEYNIFIVHFIQLPFILLCNGVFVQLDFCSLFLLHSYLYLLLQSIFAHENNTILKTFIRLVHTFSM